MVNQSNMHILSVIGLGWHSQYVMVSTSFHNRHRIVIWGLLEPLPCTVLYPGLVTGPRGSERLWPPYRMPVIPTRPLETFPATSPAGPERL
jgi:hypothetical protein